MTRDERLEAIENLLNKEDDLAAKDDTVTILPNGQILLPDETMPDTDGKKPLTFRENLGGEYAA